MEKKKLLPTAVATLSSLIMVLLMVGSAEIFGERELIFPEIAALTIGAWIAPKQSWQVGRLKLFLLITLNAFAGTAMVVFLPLPMLARALIMLAICSLELPLFKTSFAPLISAGVLPILLGTTSWVYPISAGAMAAIIVLLQLVFEMLGLREKAIATPKMVKRRKFGEIITPLLLKKYIIAAVLMIVPISLGEVFFVAPPLIVAFMEFSNLSNKIHSQRNFAVKAVLLIIFAGVCGALLRYFGAVTLGLPLTLCVVSAVALTLLAVHFTGLYLPPAGAIAVLPALIPAEKLLVYPLEIAVGIIVLTLAAVLFFRPQAVESTVQNSLPQQVIKN